jgi:glycosyltransferase involved in cell wall biosynthesis
MKVEVLVSTMFQEDISLVDHMNIKSDCVVINQTDFSNFPNLNFIQENVKYISVEERGLSKSRNLAIENASGDICLIADDDVIYRNNYIEIVKKAYEECPDADLIIFDCESDCSERKSSLISKKRCTVGYLNSLKARSVGVTFKRKSILDKQIKFNPLFGAGSPFFTSGEENLFLYECLKQKLKIYYYPLIILNVSFENPSTWFNGFDKKYFRTIGAFAYALWSPFYGLYILQFSIRKYSIYKKEMSFFEALHNMYLGKVKYKEIIKGLSDE